MNVGTPNWHDRALLKVATEARNLAKASQDRCKVANVLLERSHKDGRIISIKRSPHLGSPAPDLAKETFPCCQLKDFLKRVDRNDKEQGGKGIPLPKPAAVLDGRPWQTVEKDAGG